MLSRMAEMGSTLGWVHYLPIATTVLSIVFSVILLRRYRERGGEHHLWWGLGVITYGIGTGFEAAITLLGNTVLLNKGWYVAGALFGGYPLAQGSVYLHLKRKTAHWLTAITLPVLAVTTVLIFASPVVMEAFETHRPSGAILGWSWLRLVTPFVNLYAVIFLIGGALRSAWHFAKGRTPASRARALGNALIAFGAILPGIGGSLAKGGVVEALYIGELVGLLFIWLGFVYCTTIAARRTEASDAALPAPGAAAAPSS